MAAAVATPDVGDLHDPGYVNWLKSNRAFHRTIEVLRDVCWAEIQIFHKSLLRKHGGTPCNKPCTYKDVVTCDKGSSWSIPCPSPTNVCYMWLADIVGEKFSKSTRLYWQNSDFSQWQTQPWQIAKVFIEKIDRASISPIDTDAAGVLQLLLNCKRFKNMTNRANVAEVSSCYFLSESAIECQINVLAHIYLL